MASLLGEADLLSDDACDLIASAAHDDELVLAAENPYIVCDLETSDATDKQLSLYNSLAFRWYNPSTWSPKTTIIDVLTRDNMRVRKFFAKPTKKIGNKASPWPVLTDSLYMQNVNFTQKATNDHFEPGSIPTYAVCQISASRYARDEAVVQLEVQRVSFMNDDDPMEPRYIITYRMDLNNLRALLKYNMDNAYETPPKLRASVRGINSDSTKWSKMLFIPNTSIAGKTHFQPKAQLSAMTPAQCAAALAQPFVQISGRTVQHPPNRKTYAIQQGQNPPPPKLY